MLINHSLIEKNHLLYKLKFILERITKLYTHLRLLIQWCWMGNVHNIKRVCWIVGNNFGWSGTIQELPKYRTVMNWKLLDLCLQSRKLYTTKEWEAAKKVPLLQNHLQAKLKFAVGHTDEGKALWRIVLWSDEWRLSCLALMTRTKEKHRTKR